MTPHPVARYIPLLIEGDERGLRDLFRGPPRVNDPYLGWVEESRFDEFVEDSHQGLQERSATVEHLGTTATGDGATEECILRLVRSRDTVSLPVAIASDTSPDARLGSIRIYHSMRPLLGFHIVRAPILPVLATLVLPDVVSRYHDCLARGDLAGILEQFAPEGQLREPGGEVPIHRGATQLRRFFTLLFANGGGLGLEHCAMADEGASCALESVLTTWGHTRLPRQAAAAVYERADSGLLAEVRMYDDVEYPYQVH
ncbi:MAG TPA: nuclear transport factor 2 family protein [Vicinamibacteria bacterium]|nr:nuclear transport factor 2 family protein [Vicinamibacteria bacterium]